MWEYDTDLESTEPWLNTGDTIDDSLNNLQDFTNAKLQKQTVSECLTIVCLYLWWQVDGTLLSMQIVAFDTQVLDRRSAFCFKYVQ